MTAENAWPRIRAILDTALTTERGISITYPTWEIAETVRKNMYKVRDVFRGKARETFPDPLDPRHGVSSYDGLTFWLRSSIARKELLVTFHSYNEIADFTNTTEDIATDAATDAAAELFDATSIDRSPLLREPYRRRQENEKLFPGYCVTVAFQLPSGETTTVAFAPSYQIAWNILRRDHPCDLVIENGYSTDHLVINEL